MITRIKIKCKKNVKRFIKKSVVVDNDELYEENDNVSINKTETIHFARNVKAQYFIRRKSRESEDP